MRFHFSVAGWAGAVFLCTGHFARSAPSLWHGGGSSEFLNSRQALSSPVLPGNSTVYPGRLVFCHFMIGVVSNRESPSDYDDDMQRARLVGIDAFALNIGVDAYTDTQLELAYESAANNDMKVFLSFDFNWWNASADAQAVGQKIAAYANRTAQLRVGARTFASSFAGDELNVAAMRAAAAASGVDVFFAPNFQPALHTDAGDLDGAFNWMGWPSNGDNKAPDGSGNVTVGVGDAAYQAWLGRDRAYIAPVSAWFSTHFGAEVPYSKNWVFPSGLLWFQRWSEILALAPSFVEMVTWNDYGESHYLASLSSPHTDDGSSQWVNDMPHDGWLDMAKPFIAAYHAGATSVDDYITQDQLLYWYRPTPRTLDCDATDTTMSAADNATGNYFEGRPNGWQDMDDAVYVVTLLTAAANVAVISGNTTHIYHAPAGAAATSVPMGIGSQSFQLSRGNLSVLSGTSLRDVSNGCPCGIYNFNAYVGTLPSQTWAGLQPDGLAAFTSGLRVTTCKATPTIYAGSSISGTAASPSATGISSPSSPSATLSSKCTLSTMSAGCTGNPRNNTACNGGTAATGEPSNLVGLCSFACGRGYCPPGPCSCTSWGNPIAFPTQTGAAGCPLSGEDARYLGLCSFSCSRGYCPETACTTNC